ncbi:MAG: PH domain-containing protein [Thermoproteota archaeon]
MANSKEFEAFNGERIEVSLKPHPLSFLRYFLVCLYLALLAVALHIFHQWLYQNVWSNPNIAGILNSLFSIVPGLSPEEVLFLMIFWVVLVLSGLLIGILWISKMPLLYMILIGISGTLIEFYMYPEPITKSATLFFSAIIGLTLTDIYRRGHKYFLTNYRIIAMKKFISKEAREIMYDKITDIHIHQGVLGRIFNYGTIIPITESGLGLGEDASLAAVSAGGGSVGVTFGWKRGVSRPRTATYFSLYGVPNPGKVRGIINSRILETKEASILRRIEDLLQEEREKKELENSEGA